MVLGLAAWRDSKLIGSEIDCQGDWAEDNIGTRWPSKAGSSGMAAARVVGACRVLSKLALLAACWGYEGASIAALKHRLRHLAKDGCQQLRTASGNTV